jgi:glycosyltransferase involved in cell wall biosynthesis
LNLVEPIKRHQSHAFYLASLRFAPGNWQHMESFARRLSERNYAVRFLISESYRWMNNGFGAEFTDYVRDTNSPYSMVVGGISLAFNNCSLFRDRFQAAPPSGLLLVMWHPLNFWLVRLVKALYPDVPIIIWLHEPYKVDKRVYGTKALVFHMVEFFQTLSLRYIDAVVVHSGRARRLFEKRYPDFPGLTKRIPLHFLDDGPGAASDRRYISFLGRADRAKGIHLFFQLVETATEEGLGWEFQIITPSDIRGHLQGLSARARKSLRVVNRPQISDREIREGAANSLAVMALYKETMQSGVIPVALMKGTPVVGTGIEGLTEWLQDQKTGVIVSAQPSVQEIKHAVSYILAHFDQMTGPCREYYLGTFDDGNWERDYGWVRGLLRL